MPLDQDGFEKWLKDFQFKGRVLRIFWRGIKGLRYPLPYYYHDYGYYAFGILLIGFMFWPKEK